jgi:chlorite dismutase
MKNFGVDIRKLRMNKQQRLAIDFLEKTLSELAGVKYFLGGSCRFGYETDRSDLDVFIYIGPAWNPESLLDFLNGDTNALIRTFLNLLASTPDVIRKPYHGVGDCHVLTWILGQQVDVILFTNKDNFENLKQEHARVETYLQNYPEVVNLFKGMCFTEEYSLGQEKYRAIIARLKEE